MPAPGAHHLRLLHSRHPSSNGLPSEPQLPRIFALRMFRQLHFETAQVLLIPCSKAPAAPRSSARSPLMLTLPAPPIFSALLSVIWMIFPKAMPAPNRMHARLRPLCSSRTIQALLAPPRRRRRCCSSSSSHNLSSSSSSSSVSPIHPVPAAVCSSPQRAAVLTT